MSTKRFILSALLVGIVAGCEGGGGSSDDPYIPDDLHNPPAELPPTMPAPVGPFPLVSSAIPCRAAPPSAGLSTSNSIAFISDLDVAGVMELYRFSVGDGITSKINAPLVPGGEVTFFRVSPDGQKIAYIAEQEVKGSYELYLVTGDGTVSKIAGSLRADECIYWAPDSSAIAYLTSEAKQLNIASHDNSLNMSLTIDQLKSMDDSIESSAIFSLKQKGANNAWSPDSSHIAYVVVNLVDGEEVPSRLFASNMREATAIAPVEFQWQHGFEPLIEEDCCSIAMPEYQWSPDSLLIAVMHISNDTFPVYDYWGAGVVTIYNRDGTLGLDPEEHEYFEQKHYSAITGPSFRWSPDSSKIATTWGPFDFGSYMSITSIDKGALGSVELFFSQSSGGEQVGAPSWSPDSSRIAFINTSKYEPFPGESTLFSVLADSNLQTDPESPAIKLSTLCSPCDLSAGNFTTEALQINGTAPAWAPNGSWVAYVNLKEKAVYLVDPDGGLPYKVSHTLSHANAEAVFGVSPGQLDYGGVSFDIWSPDSNRVLYLSDDVVDETYYLFSAAANGSGSDRIGAIISEDVALLGYIPSYAKWAPDSSLILYLSIQGDQYQLVLSSPDGTEQRNLADNINPEYFEWMP